jgi:hypothetical protein
MRSFSFCLILLFVGSPLFSVAQPTVSDAVRTSNILNRLQQQNGLSTGDLIVPSSSAAEHEVEGDPYWDIHWGKGALQFYEKDRWATGYIMRYNIQRNDFELLFEKTIRVIEGKQIRHMVFLDSLSGKTRFLINAKEYKEEDVPMIGFFEVLVDGKNALMKYVRLEILKPDFSPALNVGSKNTRIVKKESYFFNIDRSVYRIRSKKSMDSLFSERETEMNLFIKREGIRFNRESDLIKLFSYFSSAR